MKLRPSVGCQLRYYFQTRTLWAQDFLKSDKRGSIRKQLLAHQHPFLITQPIRRCGKTLEPHDPCVSTLVSTSKSEETAIHDARMVSRILTSAFAMTETFQERKTLLQSAMVAKEQGTRQAVHETGVWVEPDMCAHALKRRGKDVMSSTAWKAYAFNQHSTKFVAPRSCFSSVKEIITMLMSFSFLPLFQRPQVLDHARCPS